MSTTPLGCSGFIRERKSTPICTCTGSTTCGSSRGRCRSMTPNCPPTATCTSRIGLPTTSWTSAGAASCSTFPALPAPDAYGETRHAALQLLELADVDGDDLVTEAFHQRRTSRAIRRHEHSLLVENDHVCPGLLRHRPEARDYSSVVDKRLITDDGSIR